ncbi:MAG: hypothetical protein R3E48_21865 [Burkholderiaceae bacterium]
MTDELDHWLARGGHEPPPDFVAKVMARIEAEAGAMATTDPTAPAGATIHERPRAVASNARWADRLRDVGTWLALAGGGALGLSQLLAFAFGAWAAGVAN